MNKQTKASRIGTVIIFLALIRCISEPFRLQYFSAQPLFFEDMKPFLIGALVAATGLFMMNLLSFWQFHRAVMLTAVLSFIGLLAVKWYFIS